MAQPLDSARALIEKLPPFPLEEAAWLAGLTSEALVLFLENGGLRMAAVEKRGVPLLDLVRTAYAQLSQKETQIEMMRMRMVLNRQPDPAKELPTPREEKTKPAAKSVSTKPSPAKKGGKKK